MKRPALSRTSELDKIKTELFELMASAQEKTVDEIRAAAEGAASEATILDLGMTSAMGIALKGRVLRQMEAELTTFQLLKQPLQEVIEAIDIARRESVGATIPALAPNPDDAGSSTDAAAD